MSRLIFLLVALLLLLLIPVSVSLLPPAGPAAPVVPGPTPPPADPPPDRVPPDAGAVPPVGSTDAPEPAPSLPVPPGPAGERGSPSPVEPASPAEPVAAGEEPRPPGWFPELTGTVKDVRTGEAVEGARVIYGPFPGWWGSDAGSDGGFRFEIPGEGQDPEKPFRIRVTAPGYETFEVVPRDGELLVELVPRAGPPQPGSIRGRAEDRDGRPIRGVVGVVLGDEEVRKHWLAVFADENGEFLLEAVEPGGWMVQLEFGIARNVFVPSGGEVQVVLRSGKLREEIERRRFTAEDGARLEDLLSMEEVAQLRLRKLENADAPADEMRAARGERDRLIIEAQRLEVKKRRDRDRRPVTVLRVPGRDGSRLVAEWHGGASTERWWAVVRNGRARFPALFAATWHLILKSEDGERSGAVDVDEERDVEFPEDD